MKISKAKLDEVAQDEEGKPFEDSTTYGKLLRTAASAAMYASGDGRPVAFDESADDKFKIGMVAFKIARATKNLVLSTDDVQLLKKRMLKIYSPPTYVRLCDLLEDKGTAEKRAEKENAEGDE